ncbi:hypothetical protein MCEMSE15_02700 [Fimbriimonadaceae bacterium]
MLAVIASAFLASSSLQSQDPTIPSQITEAYGKLAKKATALKAEVGDLAFRKGACLLGGLLKQGGQYTFVVQINEPSAYSVLTGVPGNAPNVELTVKDASGKNTVTLTDDYGSLFEAKAAGKYTITASNKGAETFVALALVTQSGGMTHPFTAINAAAASVAAGVKESYQYGYGVPSNQLMALGAVVEPGGNSGHFTTYNFPKWLMLAGADAGPKSFQLTVTDPGTKQSVTASSEKAYSFCEIDHAITNAAVSTKNTGSKQIMYLQAVMR